MLDGLNTTLHIGVSRTGIALLKSSGWMRPRIALLSESTLAAVPAVTVERLVTQLGCMISKAKCRNMAATVILADDWARLFMVTPPHNATRLQDCRAAAEMRFQALYGESIVGWQLEADWHANRPFLACAMPQTLLGALREVASEHRLKLIEVVPQFIAAWNRWHSSLMSDSWFGVVHAGRLTLGIIDAKDLCAVRSTPVPHDACQNVQWLPEHIAREAMRLNLTAPNLLQLCGNGSDHWSTHRFGALTCERLDIAQRATDSVAPSEFVMLAQTGVLR